ncbi:MAG: hypothetical protein AB7G35_18265, partial [Hyphomicrobiaceae bacterium]
MPIAMFPVGIIATAASVSPVAVIAVATFCEPGPDTIVAVSHSGHGGSRACDCNYAGGNQNRLSRHLQLPYVLLPEAVRPLQRQQRASSLRSVAAIQASSNDFFEQSGGLGQR